MLLDNGRSWGGGVGGESGGGGLERSALLGDLLVEGGDLVVEMGLIKGREMMRDTRLGFRGRHRERYGVYEGGRLDVWVDLQSVSLLRKEFGVCFL